MRATTTGLSPLVWVIQPVAAHKIFSEMGHPDAERIETRPAYRR